MFIIYPHTRNAASINCVPRASETFSLEAPDRVTYGQSSKCASVGWHSRLTDRGSDAGAATVGAGASGAGGRLLAAVH